MKRKSVHPIFDVPIDRIQRLVSHYERFLNGSPSFYEVKKQSDKLFSLYSIHTVNQYTDVMFRCRPNEGLSVFNNVSELWYPPEEKIKKYGRLNPPNVSRFYASVLPHTAIAESRPQAGSRYTISRLRPKAGFIQVIKDLAHVGLRHSRVDQNIKLMQDRGGFSCPEFIKYAGKTYINRWNFLDDFLNRLFTREVDVGCERLYYPTVAFSDAVFENPEFSGFYYPSVMFDLMHVNVCLKKRIADEMRIDKLFIVEVEEVRRIGLQIDYIRFRPKQESLSIGTDGLICWSNEGVFSQSFYDSFMSLKRTPKVPFQII